MNSSPVELTRTSRVPSSFSPTGVRCCMPRRSLASTCRPSLLQREPRASRATRRGTEEPGGAAYASAMGDQGTLLLVLDLVGIFVFAITGGLVAVRKRL